MNSETGLGIAALFDALASGHDREVLRYAAFCADRLVLQARPAPAEKLLDVATGSGLVALAAAQAVGPGGRVTAIDIAEGMLARLEAKLAQFGIANVDVHAMDGARLDFRRDYFHHVVCSLALFWFADPVATLREWLRVTRAGGNVMFTVFGTQAFEPQLGLLRQRLARLGSPARAPWESLAERRVLESDMRAAGFMDIRIHDEQLGYHLKDAQQWWEVVWYSGLRTLLEPLTLPVIEQVRAEHMAEIAPLVTPDGLWLNVPVLFAHGRKPGDGNANKNG